MAVVLGVYGTGIAGYRREGWGVVRAVAAYYFHSTTLWVGIQSLSGRGAFQSTHLETETPPCVMGARQSFAGLAC